MSSHHRILPLVVASALFMENMDSTVIATSLPAIAVFTLESLACGWSPSLFELILV
jgi:hypothetical protein